MQSYRVVIIFLLIKSVLCKKILPDKFGGSEKLNECTKCKVLTDSFAYWIEKTSRGKHEGGDTAWEESKLRSYSRSEMRLVEIQEGLCSELKRHKDQCYSLAEESEQPLEQWWFKGDVNSIDLHTWLCIDTLQHCCPPNHFGESCEPCMLDKDNQICGGHGKCDGEGTRKGDGTCKCEKGYSGKYCEDCSKNYFKTNDNLCNMCHRSCDGCTGSAPEQCINCRKGWILESGTCVDINECAEASTCGSNEYCLNKEGSHTCKPCDNSCQTCSGKGPDNCTSCKSPNTLWKSMCISDKQKTEYKTNALKRAALYVGLIISCIFILRTSKVLASFIILLIAVYIYYAEKVSNFRTIEIIQYSYF